MACRNTILPTLSTLGALLTSSLLLAACADEGAALDEETSAGSSGAEATTSDADPTTGDPAPTVAGSCEYSSPFTQARECREYTGAGWTGADVESACSQLMGTVALDTACDTADVLGRCVLDDGTDLEYVIVAYGTDADSCGDQRLGCETFGGGTWEPASICEGEDPGGGSGGGSGSTDPFPQPRLICTDPLPGEPPGNGENGQVCTWQMISGATEEGRHFDDYADCDVVRVQRPYGFVPPNEAEPAMDPRMDDPAYVTELDWVRSQIEATACVCCHADIAPNGASNWTIDAQGNWMSTFYDTGLALGAGWIDSTSFGAYPPEENNGFDRRYGIPSTDPERMKAFFEAELTSRGLTEADFSDATPFGGPLYTQLIYEPGRCENGEGVAQDGTLNWTGGDARYVYVLEADSANPTVPPNLDLPDGTLWRVDVPEDGTPLASGSVRYGDTPNGMAQRFPAAGAPTELVPGQDYYLYVTRDVIIPVTRCLFTYGG